MVSFFDDETQVVPLIICNNSKYTVCEETLTWLESIQELCVIACAGKYRTGKSFLLNRLASAESNVGFGVGDSVQACTKGLWLYKKKFERNGKNIVFVDTEGIDALDADDTHDVRIFTLALLLSSAFIYNSMGPIDETALQTLSLMTRVTENVKFDNNDNVQDLSPHMPQFYWVLRDFSLRLTNRNNEDITENEYLEEALQLSCDASKNSVREAIKSSFPNRKLITLPRPSTNIDPSQRMEERLMSLSNAFVKGVDQFRNSLFEESKPMHAQDTTINGKMYSMLCRHYAEVIQSNAVPVIKDSWSLLASVKARDVKENLIIEATHKISQMRPKVKGELENDMNQLRIHILEQFAKQCMKPIDEDVQNKLETQLNQLIDDAFKKLELNIRDFVEKSFQSLESAILESPEQLSDILNAELEKFTAEHDNQPDFIKMWMSLFSERALNRWIPRSIHHLSSRCNDRIQELENTKKSFETQLSELKESQTEFLQSEKTKYSELEQILESHKKKIKIECENNLRFRSEMFTLSLELRNVETFQKDLPVICDTNEFNSEELISNEELTECKIQNAELKAKLSSESMNAEKNLRLYKDTNERLEKAISTHAQLEENWKIGIEKLRMEQKINFETQKKNNDMKMIQNLTETNKIKSDLEKEYNKNEELKDEKRRMEEKITQDQISYDRNISHLKESVQRHRDQSEAAQERVLKIHKEMLEDLRIRDERSREQQAKIIRETSEYQQKLSEFTRENECNKSEMSQLKRRISQYESMEIETKRLKVSDREKDILVGQLQSENTELRSTNNEMLHEREVLRKENMSMEGELAVLRAEKQLNEARKNMSAE